MATIGKVSAVFTASSSGLRSGVNQASRSMKGLEGSVNSLRGSMRTLVAIQGAQFFGSIVSGASSAARSLLAYGQSAAQGIDRTAKLSQQLGFTYGEMAGLGLAAQLAGTDMEVISKAVTKANVAFANAAGGSKTAVDAFARIGLSVEDLNGLSASEQFDKIGAAIAGLPSQAERAAAAVALFGEEGVRLLPLFQAGAGGIAQARADAERFGLTLSNLQAGNVEAMNDAFTRAQAAVGGVIDQITAYLAPAIESVTTAFTELIGGIGGANIGQFIGEGILTGARFFAQIADQFVTQTGPLFQYLATVGGIWGTVWEVGDRVGQAFLGTAKFLEAVFKGIVAGITEVAGRLTTAAGQIASSIPGFGQSGAQLEAAGASLRQSAAALGTDAAAALSASGEAFGNVLFGRSEEAGQAIAGPITSSLDDAIQRARDAAASRDESVKQVVEIKPTKPLEVDAKPIKEAVKGIDSRSQEGIKEMFRIMRGTPDDDVAERQLAALDRIADNTEDMDDLDFDVVNLAAAAGG